MEDFSWPESPSRTAFPIARPGYPLMGAAAFITLVLALLGLTLPALLGLAVTFAVCGFFRDPDRVIPTQAGAVVSPADGRVIVVEKVVGGPGFTDERLKISIFMSVFNVHVNRAPAAGRIERIHYRPGRFVPADRGEASLRNEHNAVTLETDDGRQICFVQIAGLIARRIICNVQPGDRVLRGQRFGMICFGSRLDVYLPPDTPPGVRLGDRATAGATILGTLPETGPR